MMLRERFVLAYAAIVFVTAILVSASQLDRLDIHFSIYAIEFLLLVEFLAYNKRSFSRTLRPVTIALLIGFFYIVAQRVIEVIVRA
jgi:hypothetical protein